MTAGVAFNIQWNVGLHRWSSTCVELPVLLSVVTTGPESQVVREDSNLSCLHEDKREMDRWVNKPVSSDRYVCTVCTVDSIQRRKCVWIVGLIGSVVGIVDQRYRHVCRAVSLIQGSDAWCPWKRWQPSYLRSYHWLYQEQQRREVLYMVLNHSVLMWYSSCQAWATKFSSMACQIGQCLSPVVDYAIYTCTM